MGKNGIMKYGINENGIRKNGIRRKGTEGRGGRPAKGGGGDLPTRVELGATISSSFCWMAQPDVAIAMIDDRSFSSHVALARNSFKLSPIFALNCGQKGAMRASNVQWCRMCTRC